MRKCERYVSNTWRFQRCTAVGAARPYSGRGLARRVASVRRPARRVCTSGRRPPLGGRTRLVIIIKFIIIDNRVLNFLDCILIGIFHWENVLNFYGHKNGKHFERQNAINRFIDTFIFGEILLACAKEDLTAATYYCQIEVKVRDRTAAVDAIFLPVSCSDIISKQ